MKIEPHPMIEEHRRRLLRAQEMIGAEMALLEARQTAEEVALTLLARIDAGHLDELDADARYLGLRSLEELAREFVEMACAGGVQCEAPSGARFQRARGSSKARDAKAHQDELLDEAIEETFPASDAPSPSHVDPDRRRPR
jgi:hypothetical protein